MQPVTVLITASPEVIPLNHYGEVGAGISVSGAATVAALADKNDTSTVITGAVTANSILACPADGLLVTTGIGQTVVVCQYGN